MASVTVTVYCNSVTSSEFPDPEDAQGAPSSGNSAPYATKAIVAGTAALTGSAGPSVVEGTITAFAAVLTVRSSGVGTIEFSRSGLTFSTVGDLAASGNFGIAGDSATFDAAALKTAIEAGLTGLVATFAATAATVDAKGFGFTYTFTPNAAYYRKRRGTAKKFLLQR